MAINKISTLVILLFACHYASSATTTVTTSTQKTLPSVSSARAAATRAPISDEMLDHALNDKRYLMRQLKCALGEAPCDPVGRRLKSLAPLVLRGACPQCTAQETKQIRKTLSHIQRNFPAEWNKLIQTYQG
ncbi:putative odorant-binding protein A10 [Ctenocephalides felis]|uniref:putative odorant-binding protein A10 n=1 Tax=Ctenocephalides felis TaxID=7515 RepID=UPI000E6E4FE1|nr:putative odorant-binding protein A10 [Ctenocephalides felis]